MMESDSLTLTVEEIATTKLAIRLGRTLFWLGVAIALPMAVVVSVPVVFYALLALLLASPVLVGILLYVGGRRDPAAS